MKDTIFKRYRPLCLKIIKHEIRKLPHYVRRNEYSSFLNIAYIGLYKAYKDRDYSYSKGEFKSYIKHKIRGNVREYVDNLNNIYCNRIILLSDMTNKDIRINRLSHITFLKNRKDKYIKHKLFSIFKILKGCKKRDREILILYYRGNTLDKLGKKFGLSTSRVFQIVKKTTNLVKFHLDVK